MIVEMLALIGYFLTNMIVKHSYPDFTNEVMNATISLCLVFILFSRMFLHIVMDKVWNANLRHFLLGVFYLFLSLDACLAAMYFSGSISIYGQHIKIASQILMYTISIGMFLFVKIFDLKNGNIYGGHFMMYQVLDCVYVVAYMILDYLILPDETNPNYYLSLETHHSFVIGLMGLLIVLIAWTNLVIVYFRKYWSHRKVLFIKIDNLFKHRKESILLTPPKGLLKDASPVMKELAHVLDEAPVRVIELNFLVKQLHDYSIAYGKTEEEATQFSAGFSSMMIRSFMKRKYDFSLFPKPIVKLLQTFKSKGEENQRTLRAIPVTMV